MVFFFFLAQSSKCQLCKLAHGSPEDLVNYSAFKDKRNKGSVWEARGRQGQLDVLFSGSSGLSEDGKRNFQKCLLIS